MKRSVRNNFNNENTTETRHQEMFRNISLKTLAAAAFAGCADKQMLKQVRNDITATNEGQAISEKVLPLMRGVRRVTIEENQELNQHPSSILPSTGKEGIVGWAYLPNNQEILRVAQNDDIGVTHRPCHPEALAEGSQKLTQMRSEEILRSAQNDEIGESHKLVILNLFQDLKTAHWLDCFTFAQNDEIGETHRARHSEGFSPKNPNTLQNCTPKNVIKLDFGDIKDEKIA